MLIFISLYFPAPLAVHVVLFTNICTTYYYIMAHITFYISIIIVVKSVAPIYGKKNMFVLFALGNNYHIYFCFVFQSNCK